MITLWTDGSYCSPTEPAGIGAVYWTDEGRIGTHAETIWARRSHDTEVMAVILALRAIPLSAVSAEIEVMTDCVAVLSAGARGMFLDSRLQGVQHVGGQDGRRVMKRLIGQQQPAELRLAHRLANWARRGMQDRRPAVVDHGLLIDRLNKLHGTAPFRRA